jgi:hypothetical protein
MKNLRIKIALLTMVGAIYAAFNPVYAQIIYTDIKPDTTIIAPDNSWGTYFIDLNNDGTDDFLLNHHNSLSNDNYQKIEVGVQYEGAEILCDASISHFPLCLSNGEVINSSSSTWFYPSTSMIHMNGNGAEGHWIGVTDKYLGVRLKVAGQWHYGWIRLDVPSNAGSYTVKDYAYNSMPNQQIIAGNAGSTGIVEYPLINKDKTIAFFPNPTKGNFIVQIPNETGRVEVFNVYGIMEQTKFLDATGSCNFELTTKGIYFIQVCLGKERYTKKLIVN